MARVSARLILQWQLESPRYHSRNGKILVQAFPSQCVAIHFKLRFLKRRVISRPKDAEPIRWKAKDSTID
jgi:hypothetical protein